MAAEPLKTLFHPFASGTVDAPGEGERVLFLGAEAGFAVPEGFAASLSAVQGFRPLYRQLLSQRIETTPEIEGEDYDAALVLCNKHKGENEANIAVHKRTTAKEILQDFPEGLDYIITGVGTGGHITACAEELKKVWPKLKVFAVEPTKSPVISGGQPGPHPIQGIGAGFIPTNLHTALLDGVIQVEAEAAKEMARRAAREEGLLVGISSGATLAAIAQKLPELPAGATVLGFNYDTGERYLSIEGFLPTE